MVCLFVILTILLLPQIGWPIAETDPENTTTMQASQPSASQLTPRTESHDKKGDLTVSVQSLEDVMKVLTSSVPNRLEANVQPVTAAEAEKYRLHSKQGVTIIWLDPKGPLGRAGLGTSDIILQVDNRPIEGLENFIDLVDSLKTTQPATLTVLDRRTGQIRNVKVLLGAEHRLQESRGNFFSRYVGATVAGIKKTARSLEEHVGYAAEKGKEAVSAAIQGVMRWVGRSEKEPLASVKKREETPVKPPRPAEKESRGPG